MGTINQKLTWRDVMGRVGFGAYSEVEPSADAAVGSDAHNIVLARAIAEEAELNRMEYVAGERETAAGEAKRQRRRDRSSALSAYGITWDSLSDEERQAAKKLPLEQTEIGRQWLVVLQRYDAEYWSGLVHKRENEIWRDLREEHRDARLYLEALRNGLPVPIGVARRREERGMMRGGLALGYGRDLERTH